MRAMLLNKRTVDCAELADAWPTKDSDSGARRLAYAKHRPCRSNTIAVVKKFEQYLKATPNSAAGGFAILILLSQRDLTRRGWDLAGPLTKPLWPLSS